MEMRLSEKGYPNPNSSFHRGNDDKPLYFGVLQQIQMVKLDKWDMVLGLPQCSVIFACIAQASSASSIILHSK
jgi:hypothetical protein